MGGEVLADLRMRLIGIPIVEQSEEGAADQRKIGEQTWFGVAGVVLLSKGVPSPVVAILDPRPVVSDQCDPGWVGAFLGVLAGKIVARLEGWLAGAFDGATALDGHDLAGEREADGDRLHRAEDQAALAKVTVPISSRIILPSRQRAAGRVPAWAASQSSRVRAKASGSIRIKA